MICGHSIVPQLQAPLQCPYQSLTSVTYPSISSQQTQDLYLQKDLDMDLQKDLDIGTLLDMDNDHTCHQAQEGQPCLPQTSRRLSQGEVPSIT